MGFHAGKETRVLFNSRAFSGYLNQATSTWSQTLGEATVFTDEGTTWKPGLFDGSINIAGRFDPTPQGDISTALATARGTGLYTVCPAGLGLGKTAFMAESHPTSFDIPASVSDVVSFTVDSQPEDGVDIGHAYRDLTAETATGNSDSLDYAGATTNGGVAILHVTAASGTTPTNAVKIQHSVDDNVWVDLVTFTSATDVTSERIAVSGTVNRYTRALWTIGGTTPSFTFAVAFARR